MAEQILGPPQSPADLDDDREVPPRASLTLFVSS